MSPARVALIVLPMVVVACTFGPQESSRFDERGDAVAGATIDVDGEPDVETNGQGEAALALSRPVVAIVTAPGTTFGSTSGAASPHRDRDVDRGRRDPLGCAGHLPDHGVRLLMSIRWPRR